MSRKKHPIEHIKRSVLKATTFRIGVIITDTIIVFALTHRYDLALGFVILTNVASTLLYYFHERIWAHIHWGSLQKK
ncbi:MAG TPA: DUF2061 domain-containing protein [Candidatus Acidoferrales bacterium]|nr:DUF2061 domain-containing protein [Candidatus Acidoferrales bacterium]